MGRQRSWKVSPSYHSSSMLLFISLVYFILIYIMMILNFCRQLLVLLIQLGNKTKILTISFFALSDHVHEIPFQSLTYTIFFNLVSMVYDICQLSPWYDHNSIAVANRSAIRGSGVESVSAAAFSCYSGIAGRDR